MNSLTKLRTIAEIQSSLTNIIYNERVAAEHLNKKFPLSILLLHDLHMGYCDFTVFEKLLRSRVGKGKFDIAVISEVLDLTSFSPFSRERRGELQKELVLGQEVCELLLQSVAKEVHIIPSNHEKRVEKRLRDYLAGLKPEDVDIIVKVVNDLLTWKDRSPKGIVWHKGFYLRVGTVWITHGDRFLLTTGATGKNILRTLGSQGKSIGFSYDNTELLVYAHEHRYFAAPLEGAQIMCWGMPACCYIPFYSIGAPASRYTIYPQSLGWGEVYLDEKGKVDWLNSKLVFIGYAKPPEQWK